MIRFMDLHYSTKIKRDVEDQLYWSLLRGVYLSYQNLRATKQTLNPSIELFFMEASYHFPGRAYEGSKFHLRLPFIWIAALGKILTIANLHRRKVYVIK